MPVLRTQELVSDNLTIPTIPAILQRVQALVSDPDSGLREIGAVVAEDAPITAKVLRLANSAYYGLQERCVSAEHATSVLGPKVLRNIVMQASVMSQFEHLRKIEGFDLDGLWQHSAAVAQTAEQLARASRGRKRLDPDEAYICGLLHDLGQVVMLEGLGAAWVAVHLQARRENVPSEELEAATFGFDHADVGAMIAKRWGLPDLVVETIANHHTVDPETGESSAVSLVALAERLVHASAESEPLSAEDPVVILAASVLRWSLDEVSAALEQVRARIETMEA